MLEKLTVDDFKPLIGDAFLVRYPEHSDTLTLIEANASAITPSHNFQRSFNLLFEGEDRLTMLGQSIHPLTHPAFGQLDLFLVPRGTGAKSLFQYEAVFA